MVYNISLILIYIENPLSHSTEGSSTTMNPGTGNNQKPMVGPRQPSSPLSSASEMLAMLQSLPLKLEKLQSLKEVMPSLTPVRCRAPPTKRSSPFLIDVSKISQDILPCSKRRHLAQIIDAPQSPEANVHNSENDSNSSYIHKDLSSEALMSSTDAEDKTVVCVPVIVHDNRNRLNSNEDAQGSKSNIVVIDLDERSDVLKTMPDAINKTTFSRPDNVQMDSFNSSIDIPDKEVVLGNRVSRTMANTLSVSVGPKKHNKSTGTTSKDKMTQTRIPLLGKTTQTSETDFLPSRSPHVRLMQVNLPLQGPQKSHEQSEMEKLKIENSKLKNEKAQIELILQESKTKLQEYDTKICTLLRREKELFEELQETKSRLRWEGISQSSSHIKYYTGLPDAATFDWILGLCSEKPIAYHCKWRVNTLSLADQLLMTLMMLKLNIERKFLGYWFDVSVGTVSNVERTWLSLLYNELYSVFFIDPLTDRRKDFPQYFSVEMESRCFYGFVEVEKGHHFEKTAVVKGILGVSSSGSIISASKLYANMNESDIIKESGVTDLLLEGDFLLEGGTYVPSESLCSEDYCNYTPPSLQVFNKGQSLIEKAFYRIKEYSIIEHIPVALASVASEVWQVCAALTYISKSVCHKKSVEDS